MTLDYKQSGVDIEAGDALVSRIAPLAAKTFRQGVMTGLGGFGALFHLGGRYRDPVLVSGTDGAGTKVKLASQWHRHQGIGQDLVAMCVNDILVQGAEPLFFLDYFACGKLNVDVATAVIASIAQGCTIANCALVGGETAEMPDMYAEGEYDLAGFAVGAVEKNEIIDGASIAPGDVILGLPSSGPHANGFSLIRRILRQVTDPEALVPPGMTTSLLDALMTPTQIYVRPVLSLMKKIPIKGMAHITGGGLPGNIPRVLPQGCRARLHRQSWPVSPLFDWLQKTGEVAQDEMYRVFNAGIGYVLILSADHLQEAQSHLAAAHQDSYRIGEIVAGGATPDVELIFS